METTSDNRERTELGALALDSELEGVMRKGPRAVRKDFDKGIPKRIAGEEVHVRTPLPERGRWKLITVRTGRKNSSGDWIIGGEAEVVAHPTICPQIWVTRPVDEVASGYVLTHLQSGFAFLWGFPDLRTAQYGAGVLAGILPVDNWDTVGQVEGEFKRERVTVLVHKLPPRLRDWIRIWTRKKIRIKKAEPDGSQNYEEIG